MLNISEHPIDKEINQKDLDSFNKVGNKHGYNRFSRIIFGTMFFLLFCVFLPWTQNVSTKGVVTSLKPEQRPQTIVANIPGRIDQWFVQEGQFVNKGDTMIQLSEIKSEYLDSNLIYRTQQQIEAKESSIEAYKAKVDALDNQALALRNSLGLKKSQAENKYKQAELQVEIEYNNYEAADLKHKNAKDRLMRNDTLFQEGLISKTKWQEIQVKEREARAKKLAAYNKYEAALNKKINAAIELESIAADFDNKYAKNRSERSSAASTLADAYLKLAQLENKKSNYQKRAEYRTVIAPQDGYVTKAIKTGIGGIVKEGEGLVTVMPKEHDLAAELYVSAVDLPLMGLHHEVNLIFDGWPVIAVSGWPQASYGTFKGEIVAIDNMISPKKGKYRILVSPKRGEGVKEWPHHLRLGSGVNGFALLNDVPVYKELWRRMNGFPPDFYQDYKPDIIIGDKKKKD